MAPLLTRLLSHVRLFAASWPVACQTPLSIGFCRKEYWSMVPLPISGDLPNPGIKTASLGLLLHRQVDSLPLALPGRPTYR